MAEINPLSELHAQTGAALLRAGAASVPEPASPAQSAKSAESGDRLELSAAAQFMVDERDLQRAILLKTALEGKDYQTARKEATAEQAQDAQAQPAQAQTQPETATGLQITTVEASQVTLEVRTETGGVVRLSATRVAVQQVSVAGTGAASKDPLLVDLSGAGPDTTGAEGAQRFDLAGDGQVAATSFVRGGSAFLALDRNGDGRIDSGLELFGDQHGAVDGYAELAKFDQDGNGVIDARDPVFAQLQLLHGDGSQTGLTEHGIVALSTRSLGGSGRNAAGDQVLGSATATTADGAVLSTYAMGLQRFESMA